MCRRTPGDHLTWSPSDAVGTATNSTYTALQLERPASGDVIGSGAVDASLKSIQKANGAVGASANGTVAATDSLSHAVNVGGGGVGTGINATADAPPKNKSPKSAGSCCRWYRGYCRQ